MDPQIEKLQRIIEAQVPESADVIVWLQGDRYDRGSRVLELYQKKYAPRVMIAGNNILIGSDTRPGENNISIESMVEWLLERGVPEADIIVDDQSMNTRDQAMRVLERAGREQWERVILVGSRHHQLRSFLTFLKRAREIGWRGCILNQTHMIEWDSIPGGRDKSAREIFLNEAAKLRMYMKHVATTKEGLDYLKREL